MSRPITRAQIRAIHAAVAALGIRDADYRDRLRSRAGVESSTEMTSEQATAFLLGLGRPLRPRPSKAKPASRPRRLPQGVVRLATPAQRRLIDALAGEIAWRTPNGYRGWLHQNMGLRRIRTTAEAARVIEGLKALKRR